MTIDEVSTEHHVVLIDRPGLYAGLATIDPADHRRIHYPTLMAWFRADELSQPNPMPLWVTVFGPQAETTGNTAELRQYGYRYRSVPPDADTLDVMAQMIRQLMREQTIGFLTIVTGLPNMLTERLDNFGRWDELEKRVIGLPAPHMRPRRGMYEFININELADALRAPKTKPVTNAARRRSRRGSLRPVPSLPVSA